MRNNQFIHMTAIALTVLVTVVSSASNASNASNHSFTAPEGKLFKRALGKDRKFGRGKVEPPPPPPPSAPISRSPAANSQPAVNVKQAVVPTADHKATSVEAPIIKVEQVKAKPAVTQPAPAKTEPVNQKQPEPPAVNNNAPGPQNAADFAKLFGTSEEMAKKLLGNTDFSKYHQTFEKKTITTTTVVTPKSVRTFTETIEEPPRVIARSVLNEEFLNEVRRSYQGGEGSDNIRSESYLNQLTQAFHFIYNKLENRGTVPSLGDRDGAHNTHTPDFGTGMYRSDDFENYPIVRGSLEENTEIAALSMQIKVQVPTTVKTGLMSYESRLKYCGAFYQVTMANNGGSANQWTTRINPGPEHIPKGTDSIAECMNAEEPEAQTVFSKDPAADTVHVGRPHHPAMIEAIILMVLDGEARNKHHRLSFWDNPDEPESLAAMRELVLEQSQQVSQGGKLINDADFSILNY